MAAFLRRVETPAITNNHPRPHSGWLLQRLPHWRRYGAGGDGGMVMEAHPLDLRGWWHRPHIPTRGEEARDGFSLWSATAHDSRKAPPDLSVRWVVLATRRMFDEWSWYL